MWSMLQSWNRRFQAWHVFPLENNKFYLDPLIKGIFENINKPARCSFETGDFFVEK